MIDRNTEAPNDAKPVLPAGAVITTELELKRKRFFFSFLCDGKY